MNQLDDLLFSQHSLSDVIRGHEQKMLKEIDDIESNRLLNTSVEDLVQYFVDEYKIETPRIKEDEIAVDQLEAKVDVSRDHNRVIFDRSKPFFISGTSLIVYVPFLGDSELFKCRPSTYDYNPPRAKAQKNEVVLTFTRTDHDAAAAKSEIERSLNSIRKYLGWIANDVAPFNALVEDKARKRVEARREKLLSDQGLVAGLGIPLRKRADASQTYVVPTVQRKIPIPKPLASKAPYVPEPVLDIQEYEHILSIIQNMVAVMERSPAAFRTMGEEDLRQHFLVQLNGHYEGQATGETFNFEGKTDILIRVNGKNIFIAECKIWRGAESFKQTIDQILGYATWRDTKNAVLIFNRSKNLTNVLKQVPELVKTHPQFKRELGENDETSFRYIFHHRDDPNRELLLSVLVFDVPA